MAGTFLLILAAWQLVCACFETGAARWGGVALLGLTLTVPVAGTALAIADPYVTSRTLSTPVTLFAIAAWLSGRRGRAGAWWFASVLIHPQMAVYSLAFLGCLAAMSRSAAAPAPAYASAASALPFLFEFGPARGAARAALFSRTYFFVSQWEWYEWLGVGAPLALLWWFSGAAVRGTRPAFRRLSRALVPFTLFFTACAILLAVCASLENYTRLQPMRALHLVYVAFFLLLGGLTGEYVLGRRIWRWLALFVRICCK